MRTLYDELNEYGHSDYYGFHMPGHKRNKNITRVDLPYDIDITEITGFDDLHHAEGILQDAQERAAKLYHAEETHYLINGSTSGILSAILGSTKRGDTILVARNCHKSVYHAIYLNELKAEYVYPKYDKCRELNGPVDPADIRKALEKNVRAVKREINGVQAVVEDKEKDFEGKIRAVVIVSPTYDGVLSYVREIADIVHEYGIPLIVDEAHGAHFGLHPYFPENANTKGADIVIHSLHKTLPSLTQTALIHMNGNIVDRESVRMYLHMLQTSSPSYVLMAGMDACICTMQERGRELFDAYVEILKDIRAQLQKLKWLKLVETGEYDRSKLVLSVKNTGITGNELHRRLQEQYHLEMEMAAVSYVLAMTTVGDTKEGLERLADALFEIDAELEKENRGNCEAGATFSFPREEQNLSLPVLEQVYVSSEHGQGACFSMKYKESAGYVSAEYAYLYPPGIPVIVPGERISKEAAELLMRYEAAGFEISGVKHSGEIRVWKE